MGKSNKFDFSNRPSSGPKLGKSIFQTLQREAQKIRKDRETIKPRPHKDSPPSDLARDEPSREVMVHSIDFHANEKHLGDEGIGMVADGLCAALEEQSDLVHVALEELNLAGNQISSKSLSGLTRVVRLARHSVKAINLADNCILVVTNTEAEDFEAFFRACCQCTRLQRLDFSGNAMGPRAFERLARIYQTIPDFADSSSSRRCNTTPTFESIVSSTRELHLVPLPAYRNKRPETHLQGEPGPSNVPVVSFHDTDLTDDSALWLSYIVERPLVPLSVSPVSTHSAETNGSIPIRVDADFTAIHWNRDASSLGKDAQALLKRAEIVRQKRLSAMDLDADDQSSDNEQEVQENLRHELLDLESIRKKVQRLVLEHDGSSKTDLWHTSLSVLEIARKVRYVATKAFLTKLRTDDISNMVLRRLLPTENGRDKENKLPDDPVVEKVPAPKMVYTTLRIVNANSTVHEATPTVQRSNGHHKPSNTKHDRSSTNGRLNGKSNDKVRLTNERRDLMAIIRRILHHTLKPQQIAMLSSVQLEHAIAWGMSKETLAIERQWSKHSDSLKTWMLLDSIHGLSYDAGDGDFPRESHDDGDSAQ